MVVYLFPIHGLYCQKRAEKWIFGNGGAGLDFSCNPPFPVSGNSGYYSVEGCTSISDEDGNLLFYSNGEKVWNRNHVLMPNGFDMGITPDCFGSTTQGCLIVPHPGNSDLYYLFTIDCAEIGQYLVDQGFRYSIIDMSLEGGLGDVTDKAIPLSGSTCEKLAAVHHADGESVWVVVHEYGTDAFLAYLINEGGLDESPVISNQGVVQIMPDDLPVCWGISSKRGHMKFSPQGDKIVVVSASDCHPWIHPVQLFHFNNENGEILLNFTLEDPDSVRYYGASFSPDGNLLYLSNAWYGLAAIDQFDLSSNDPASVMDSKYNVYTGEEFGPVSFGGMQIGPDGKIYVSEHNAWVGVIADPNTYGPGCNHTVSAIDMATCPRFTFSEFGLPNFIESYFLNSYEGQNCSPFLEADFSVSGSSVNENIEFTDLSTAYPGSPSLFFWNFGDPDSGAQNTSELQNPAHVYSEPGTYLVTLTVITNLNENFGMEGEPCMIDSVTTELTITVNETAEVPDQPDFIASILDGQLLISDTAKNTVVSVYDTSGRLVLNYQGKIQGPISCGHITNGIYLLTVAGESGNIQTQRLIKAD
jgi:PKD repeat protein